MRHATLDALGKMSHLLSGDRLLKNACPILTVLIGSFKRPGDPYYTTCCVFQTIDAICSVNPQVVESVMEALMTALFTQVLQNTLL